MEIKRAVERLWEIRAAMEPEEKELIEHWKEVGVKGETREGILWSLFEKYIGAGLELRGPEGDLRGVEGKERNRRDDE